MQAQDTAPDLAATTDTAMDQPAAGTARCGGLERICNMVADLKLVVQPADHATIAAACGDMATIQWFDAKLGGRWSPQAMDAAAANGHLDAVIFLHERGAACTTHAMDGAAANGHLPIVEFLHEHRTEGCSPDAVVRAAAGGHQHVIEWFHVNMGSIFTDAVMDAALTRGHVSIAEWLHLHRTESCSPTALVRAVENGQVESTRWMFKNMPRVEWDLKPDNQISEHEKEFPDPAKSAPVADAAKDEAIELVGALDKGFVASPTEIMHVGGAPAADAADRTHIRIAPTRSRRFADGAETVADLLNWLPAEIYRQIMLRAGTLTRLLHGDLPLPLSVDTLRSAVADCFELDRTDIARKLLLPPDTDLTESSDPTALETAPLPPVHPSASVPLTVELLLVRSRQMARTVAEAVRPAGVGLFTRLDLLRLAEETNGAPVGPDKTIFRPRQEGLLGALDLVVSSGQTRRSPQLARVARRVLLSLEEIGLVPQNVSWRVINQWVTAAAGLGDIQRVRMLLPHVGKMPPLRALDAAGLHGHVEIVKLVAEECKRHARAAAAQTGRSGFALLSIDGGVVGGQIECIQAVHALDSSIEPSRLSISMALERNNLAAVWWLLLTQKQSWRMECFQTLQTTAARTGHMDVLEFAMRNGIGERADADGFDGAAKARNGHMSIIESYMAKTQCALDEVLAAALAGGHLEIARIIKNQGRGAPTARCMVEIGRTGRVDAAAWVYGHLKNIGATVPDSALLMACRGNHADLAAFLIDECGLAATDGLRDQALRYGSTRSAAVVANRMLPLE
nr:hypothetical protein HK105_001778 [Polyrhizophydium stewartii]